MTNKEKVQKEDETTMVEETNKKSVATKNLKKAHGIDVDEIHAKGQKAQEQGRQENEDKAGKSVENTPGLTTEQLVKGLEPIVETE